MNLPENFYAHPMFVHFPQALFPVAFASFLLYLATGTPEFETGAFVSAGFGAAASAGTCVVLGHHGGKLVFH